MNTFVSMTIWGLSMVVSYIIPIDLSRGNADPHLKRHDMLNIPAFHVQRTESEADSQYGKEREREDRRPVAEDG